MSHGYLPYAAAAAMTPPPQALGGMTAAQSPYGRSGDGGGWYDASRGGRDGDSRREAPPAAEAALPGVRTRPRSLDASPAEQPAGGIPARQQASGTPPLSPATMAQRQQRREDATFR